jgi:hypothetical protein
MPSQPTVLKGVVRDGVIVFEAPWPLPDGTEVEFVVTRHVFTAKEQAEFDALEKASDEDFRMILDLERQDRDASR